RVLNCARPATAVRCDSAPARSAAPRRRLVSCLSMIFSENRFPLFGIMLWRCVPAAEMLSVPGKAQHRGTSMHRKGLAATAAIALLTLAIAAPAQAQNWPSRTVKFIVPFGPGAGADIGARLFAEKLTTRWGHPVVIENRPGGDSIVAIQ